MKNNDGFMRTERRIPYDPKLKERARILRKNMTRSEKHLWETLLRKKQLLGLRFLRQRPIDNYIVDFYCPKQKLVIEIDGEIHEQHKEYDADRTIILERYGVRALRFANNEILKNISGVESKIKTFLLNFPLNEGDEGGENY